LGDEEIVEFCDGFARETVRANALCSGDTLRGACTGPNDLCERYHETTPTSSDNSVHIICAGNVQAVDSGQWTVDSTSRAEQRRRVKNKGGRQKRI
jgi:hypothetical protein